MSIFSLLLALGSQEVGEVRRDISIGSKIVRYEQPISPAMDTYSLCLERHLKAQPIYPDRIDEIFENGISQCAADRAASLAAADKLLREAGWSEPASRQKSVDQTFADMDAAHREHGQQLKAQLARMTGSAKSEKQ